MNWQQVAGYFTVKSTDIFAVYALVPIKRARCSPVFHEKCSRNDSATLLALYLRSPTLTLRTWLLKYAYDDCAIADQEIKRRASTAVVIICSCSKFHNSNLTFHSRCHPVCRRRQNFHPARTTEGNNPSMLLQNAEYLQLNLTITKNELHDVSGS